MCKILDEFCSFLDGRAEKAKDKDGFKNNLRRREGHGAPPARLRSAVRYYGADQVQLQIRVLTNRDCSLQMRFVGVTNNDMSCQRLERGAADDPRAAEEESAGAAAQGEGNLQGQDHDDHDDNDDNYI